MVRKLPFGKKSGRTHWDQCLYALTITTQSPSRSNSVTFTVKYLHQWPPFCPTSLHTKVICGWLKIVLVILRKRSWWQHKEGWSRLAESNEMRYGAVATAYCWILIKQNYCYWGLDRCWIKFQTSSKSCYCENNSPLCPTGVRFQCSWVC